MGLSFQITNVGYVYNGNDLEFKRKEPRGSQSRLHDHILSDDEHADVRRGGPNDGLWALWAQDDGTERRRRTCVPLP